MRPLLFLAFVLGCACPKPPPCPSCAPTPTCVQDSQGQPPQPAGVHCGAGVCDGKGACCQ